MTAIFSGGRDQSIKKPYTLTYYLSVTFLRLAAHLFQRSCFASFWIFSDRKCAAGLDRGLQKLQRALVAFCTTAQYLCSHRT